MDYIEALEGRLRSCAESAAGLAGVELNWSSEWGRYLPMKRNAALEDAYEANLRFLGLEVGEFPADESIGSTDCGNVSRALPAIHPYFRVVARGPQHHTPEYAEISRSEPALRGMLEAAKAMALTGLDLLRRPELRERVRNEFRRNQEDR
jgi:metal-dependent amidase/aminoacylase/carboxypeptidase family protein